MKLETVEPEEVRAGDTATWSRALEYYPANDGWSLSYHLRNAAAVISFTASAAGADHLVEVAAAETGDWAPGRYAWIARVSKDGEVFTVGQGDLTVLPDLAQANPVDSRSHARKVLDAVEAVLENRATRDQESYTINGRSLSRTPLADLIKLRDRYRLEAGREEEAERLAKGLGSGRQVLTRFC